MQDRRPPGPSSARICFHAMVRRMKLVKNGAMTSTSSRFFHCAPRAERDRVGQRVADRQREHGRGARVDERAHEVRPVLRDGVGVVLPAEGLLVAPSSPPGDRVCSDWPSSANDGTTKKSARKSSPGSRSRYGVRCAPCGRRRRTASGPLGDAVARATAAMLTARRPGRRCRRRRPARRPARTWSTAPGEAHRRARRRRVAPPRFCANTPKVHAERDLAPGTACCTPLKLTSVTTPSRMHVRRSRPAACVAARAVASSRAGRRRGGRRRSHTAARPRAPGRACRADVEHEASLASRASRPCPAIGWTGRGSWRRTRCAATRRARPGCRAARSGRRS